MKELYVYYSTDNGDFDSDIIKISGKINFFTVQRAIRDAVRNYSHLVAWSENEPFTKEEEKEFFK